MLLPAARIAGGDFGRRGRPKGGGQDGRRQHDSKAHTALDSLGWNESCADDALRPTCQFDGFLTWAISALRFSGLAST